MNICHDLLIKEINNSELTSLWIVDENFPLDFIPQILPRGTLYAITNRAELSDALKNNSISTLLSDFDIKKAQEFAGKDFEQIFYRVSKERALVNHCINSSQECLSETGELVLIGEKHDGIKTHAKNAEKVFARKSTIKKYSNAYTARLIKQKDKPSALLDSKNYSEIRPIVVGEFAFLSKPGVFGWHKIDDGSRLLIDTLMKDEVLLGQHYRRSLDLGCGWGYLTLATQTFNIDQRIASDNNIAATCAAEENFRENKLTVETILEDCGRSLKGPFDLILCNPPFHRGFDVSGALTQKFLDTTFRLLSQQGSAIFVVNQFIPLAKLASDDFKVRSLKKTKSFEVIELRK